MSYRDTIKTYFETGDFPTQAQFWEFFDKIPFKDEGFASRITMTGTANIPIPAGSWIDKIGIVGNVNLNISVGTVEGGDDVVSDYVVNNIGSINKDIYFAANGNLYFTGLAPTTTIIIFIR